jgi:hypothetical protein
MKIIPKNIKETEWVRAKPKEIAIPLIILWFVGSTLGWLLVAIMVGFDFGKLPTESGEMDGLTLLLIILLIAGAVILFVFFEQLFVLRGDYYKALPKSITRNSIFPQLIDYFSNEDIDFKKLNKKPYLIRLDELNMSIIEYESKHDRVIIEVTSYYILKYNPQNLEKTTDFVDNVIITLKTDISKTNV